SDFCSLMQTIIQDYPNNFNNLKGEKNTKDELDFGDAWQSLIKLSNTSEAKISEPLLEDHNTWYNVLYESSDSSSARKKYNDFVSSMKSCKSGCCTLVSDTHDYKGTGYSSYSTSWLVFLMNENYKEEDYKNMLIEIELSEKIVEPG